MSRESYNLVNDRLKRFYYLTNRYFYNLFDFSKVSGLLDKCDKINKDYKNIRFNYYEDGTLLFHNNNDGSSGIVTSQGTVIYIDTFENLTANDYSLTVINGANSIAKLCVKEINAALDASYSRQIG